MVYPIRELSARKDKNRRSKWPSSGWNEITETYQKPEFSSMELGGILRK